MQPITTNKTIANTQQMQPITTNKTIANTQQFSTNYQ